MKRIITACIVILMLFALCSCIGRKSGLRNNLKTVDMSKFTSSINVPNTDTRVDDDNTSSPTNQTASNRNDGTGAQPNDIVSAGGSSSNSTDSETTPVPGTAPDISIGDDNKKIKPITKGEGSIREDTDEMQTEKYLIYLPTIIEEIEQIDRTDYGVTVHFMPTTQERFDKYVTELRNMGFIYDVSLSDTSFSAHTKNGMFVQFIVTDTESWLAIYDDARHLG